MDLLTGYGYDPNGCGALPSSCAALPSGASCPAGLKASQPHPIVGVQGGLIRRRGGCALDVYEKGSGAVGSP